jgi:protein tyrosine phosphatase
MNIPNYMTVVDNKLIRGKAVVSPLRLYKMKRENITQIIDLRNSPTARQAIERFFCKILGIKYINCKYPHRLSTLPKHEFLEHINDLILKHKDKTYIHCQYGKRRTGIAVAFYEKLHTNKSKDDIFNNLMNLGFNDVFKVKVSKRMSRYKKILKEFCQTYLDN